MILKKIHNPTGKREKKRMKKFYFGKKFLAIMTAAALMLSALPSAFAAEVDAPLTVNFLTLYRNAL